MNNNPQKRNKSNKPQVSLTFLPPESCQVLVQTCDLKEQFPDYSTRKVILKFWEYSDFTELSRNKLETRKPKIIRNQRMEEKVLHIKNPRIQEI